MAQRLVVRQLAWREVGREFPRALPPSVDLHDREPWSAADHLPHGSGFAADDDHVDILGPKHSNELIGRRLQHRRVRLDAGECTRTVQRLNPLVVPVLPGRQARVLDAPINELLLRREPAVDEAARDERIKRDDRAGVRIARLQRSGEFLFPRPPRAPHPPAPSGSSPMIGPVYGSPACSDRVNFSSHVSRRPPPNTVYHPPRNRLTVLSSGLKPCCKWNGSQV